ncbi:MAG: DUF1573 domain-containing protein [Pirellulaceae bacterium]|jgi:hypothetical protein|nr:DUF1573 domain-containing protein [Thermoguttaceae bacterium]MDI9443225.1 DUF1573 domain-containing protein [Planctomycetota bacterium]NLZ03081.1 DUF1573 domain-containing protein [Pirellulaceae bacterium]
MRLTLVFLLAAILGTASGAGLAAWRFFAHPIMPPLARVDELPAGDESASVPKAHPEVEVVEEDYFFGSMANHMVASHEFEFRNVGTAPLKLTKGQTTCKCTLSDIGDGVIPAGASGVVKLEWSGQDIVGPYAQTATIITNDPHRPAVHLRIHGEMTAKVRLFPEELVYSSITAGQSAIASARLYSYMPKPLEITGAEVEPPDHFQIAYSPLPPDEVSQEKYAKCGYLVTVTAKPGLPLGPFRGTIRLKADASDLPEVTMPVKGTVVSEITVVGTDWIDTAAVLRLGTLTAEQSIRKTLFIKVGGSRPEEVEFEVAEVSPDLIQVRLGERTSPSGGHAAITPIEIEIPVGSPPCNHLGPKRDSMGKIRLKTTHPTAKDLDIYVQFLVR